jgi:hypothetical protein
MNENGNKALAKVSDNSELACYLDTAKFEHAARVAGMLCKANMLPKQYKNSVADCLIAFNQATLMKIDPMLFMQKTYPVGGKIGIESQLAIALANKAKVFTDVIQYEFTGKPGEDDWTCRAFAHTTATGVLCEETCSVQDAKDMGWWSRGGSPWPKQTKKMLRYRSAMNLIRLYCPEVLFGLDSVEDLQDAGAQPKNITPQVNAATEEEKSGFAKAGEVARKNKAKDDQEKAKKEKAAAAKEETPQAIKDLVAAWEDPANAKAVQDLLESGQFDFKTYDKIIENGLTSTAKDWTKKIWNYKAPKQEKTVSSKKEQTEDVGKTDLLPIVQEFKEARETADKAVINELYDNGDGLTAARYKAIIDDNDAVQASTWLTKIDEINARNKAE